MLFTQFKLIFSDDAQMCSVPGKVLSGDICLREAVLTTVTGV